MGQRRKGPALYELVGLSRPDGAERAPAASRPAPTPTHTPMPPPSAEPRRSPAWMGGSRVVRAPMGFLFIGVAAVLAMVFAAYYVGFASGRAGERQRRAQEQASLLTPEQDPLNSPSRQRDAASPTPTRQLPPTRDRAAVPPPPTRTGEAVRSAAPAVAPGGDPRQAGLNYFVIARLPEDEARKAADFLTANGVAAAVVPSNNPRFREVVAARGFAGGEIFGPEANALKAEIKRVGRLYKSQGGGPKDFNDVYPRKHQP